MLTLLPVAWSADASIAYSFEPSVLSLRDHDAALEEHGFAPVRSPLLLTHGVRGRVRYDGGFTLGLSMAMAFTASEGDPVPTTTSLTRLAYTVGVCVDDRWTFETDVGFASLSHTVGSAIQGGALVYLGPWLQPRAGVITLPTPAHLELQLGYALHLPVGAAHQQPLWEEPFTRRLVHGPTLSLVTGFGILGGAP